MSIRLLKLQGNRSLNRTIFEPSVNVYDTKIVHRKRSLFKINETSIPYNHIAEVNVIQGIFFAEFSIYTTSKKEITLRWVSKSKAKKAKDIIDHKVYEAHHKKIDDTHQGTSASIKVSTIGSYEKSLNRLEELLQQKRISRHEFAKRQKELLKKI